jgi:hypothetical protein
MQNSKDTKLIYLFDFANLDLSNLNGTNSFFQRWKFPKIGHNDGLKVIRNSQKVLHKVFKGIIEKEALVESNTLRFFEHAFKHIPLDLFWKIENNRRIVLSTEPMSNRQLGILDMPQANLLSQSRPEPYLEKLTMELF